MSYCIAGHHAGLPDTGDISDTSTEGTLMGRLKKRLEDYQRFTEEIEIPELKNLPFQPVKGENLMLYPQWFEEKREMLWTLSGIYCPQ